LPRTFVNPAVAIANPMALKASEVVKDLAAFPISPLFVARATAA
jgi:hypothetical protein